MTTKKDIIFVSSEDDKHLVKGGIGTYLGIFTRVLAKEHPEFNITWISQSPNNTEFEEQDGNVRRIYLPQINQDLSLYSKSVEKRVRKIAEEKLAAGRQVIIESPEWEGQSLKEEFSRLQYLRAVSGETVTTFDGGKPAFLCRFREGKMFSPDNATSIKNAAEFLKKLHQQVQQASISGGEVFEEFRKEMDLYKSQKVVDGIKADFSKEFPDLGAVIDDIYKALPNLQKMAEPLMTRYGLVHSDFTPDNILSDHGRLELIDFDAMKADGLQIVDLLQFTTKTDIAQDKKKLSEFFNAYSGKEKQSAEDLQAFQALALLFSAKSLLSTLYYTYDIGKIDPEWVKENAMYTLNPLYKSVASLRRQLIP